MGEGRRMGGRGEEGRWLGKGYQTHLEDNLELV